MIYEYKVITTRIVDSETVKHVKSEADARIMLEMGFFVGTNEEIVFVETRDK